MSRSSWSLFASVGVSLMALSGAARADIVDQSQLLNSVYMANFSQTDLAQSFQQAHNDISGASVQLRSGIGDGNPGDITISLYSNLPNAGGTLLTQGTAVGVTAGNFAEVHWADLAITADTTYYLVLTSTNNTLGLNGDASGAYTRGQVYANPGYVPFPGYAYTFETFSVAAVPEPGSLALLGIGASGLIGVAFRRRLRRVRG